ALHDAARNADFDAWVELTRRLRSAPAQPARGVTSDLFDLGAKAREADALRGVRTPTVSRGPAEGDLLHDGAQGDLLFGADPAQSTMELFHGDTHPFTRGRVRPTLS
uniref:hypothetical protein n=1 Tax=Burkholderia gladioli TaxID=28095 RepID=UPI003C7AF0DE